jgi:uncharacterized protein
MNEATRKAGGFAGMSPERQAEIASKGGKKAHAIGTAHKFTSDEAKVAGKKGGALLARNVEHMKRIDRLGGLAVSKDREHMSKLGRMGGAARHAKADTAREEDVLMVKDDYQEQHS